MKRLFVFACVVMCLGMMGCAFYKSTTARATGNNLKVPLGGIIPIEGDIIEITIIRQVGWNVWSGSELKDPSSITITSPDGKNTILSVTNSEIKKVEND